MTVDYLLASCISLAVAKILVPPLLTINLLFSSELV